MNCKLNCLIITFLIQAIYAFSQNNLPKGSLIVAKDGSGNYKTVYIKIFNNYILKKIII